MQFLIGRTVCRQFYYPLSRGLTLSSKKKSQMSQQVITLAVENANYFLKDTSKSGKALCVGFQQLAEQCQEVTPLLDKITREAPKFDLDAETPGNGYRSFIIIFGALFKRCSSLCDLVKSQRSQAVFNLYKYSYIQDLKSWNEMLVSLNTFLEHLNTLLEWNEKDHVRSLFPSEAHSSQELLDKARTIESYSFYGRHAAFQYCNSIESVLKGLLTIMAGYSDYYFSTSPHLWRVAKSLFMSTQYTLDAEHRARRIVHASQYATVDFCKSFWFLAESDLMKKVPDRMCPAIRVNQLILIPPEPLQIDSMKYKPVNIPVPSAHGPTAPVQVRLLSAKGRPGMPGQNDYSEATVSDSLVIHCHGGGFVAQSSQSHETYLRHWAVALDVPILSIDYSLAPEYPFPRQLQEILYVYAWIQRNPSVAGTTAKKIIFAGDSAGANLMLGVTLWVSDLNLRLPDGIFLAYVPLLVQFEPSPSRLLCLLDPLLPFGFMMRCLSAYAGQPDMLAQSSSRYSETDGKVKEIVKKIDSSTSPQDASEHPAKHNTVLEPELLDRLKAHSPVDELDMFRVSSTPLMSPFLASDSALKKLPPISLLSIELDPCLDDSVEFAKRCRRLGCDIRLDILPGLPHGFLNFALLSREAKEGSKLCVKRIRELFKKCSDAAL